MKRLQPQPNAAVAFFMSE